MRGFIKSAIENRFWCGGLAKSGGGNRFSRGGAVKSIPEIASAVEDLANASLEILLSAQGV